MSMRRILAAGVLGMALTSPSLSPVMAETLRIMQGAPSSALNVPMNRAVVVESDVPFTDLIIANPGIADINTLSDRSIYVLGKIPGRTTLTLISADGKLISNVDVHVTPDIAEFKERLQQILPGETIEVQDCAVTIDGKTLNEPYLDPTVVTPGNCGPGYPATKVPENQVFVMGDNRPGSGDSRSFGPVSEDLLIGRAFVVIWPFGDWTWL